MIRWSKLTKRCVAVALTLFVVGCSYHVEKFPPNLQKGDLSFAAVKQAVFSSRCTACHDGSTAERWNCGDYPTVKARVEKIHERVLVKRDMPPGAGLTPDQLDIVSRWIAAGAPEQGKPPEKPETPLVAKYASINEKIFVPLCSKCHLPGGTAQQIPLTLEGLLNPQRELVIPFKPDESQLIISLKKKPNKPKNMPPADSGIRKLTPEEIAIIAAWIDAGAKD